MSRCSILSRAGMTSARNPATDDQVDAVRPKSILSMRPAMVSTTPRSPKAPRYSSTATAIVSAAAIHVSVHHGFQKPWRDMLRIVYFYLCAEHPSTCRERYAPWARRVGGWYDLRA